jgi:hypothetical protein
VEEVLAQQTSQLLELTDHPHLYLEIQLVAVVAQVQAIQVAVLTV